MDDNMLFEYLVEQGSMRPEEEQLLRRQGVLDALRQQSMQAPQSQQAGRAIVAPHWSQNLAQLGAAAAAKYGQKKLDSQYDAFNQKRGNSLERMRNRMAGPQSAPAVAPSPDAGLDELLIGFGR